MNGIIFELEEKSKYTGRYMDGEISYNNTSIDYTKEIRECDRKSEIKDLLNDPCLGKIFEKGEVDDEIIYNGNIEDVKEEWMRAIQKSSQEIEKVNPLYAFKLATAYFRGQGMVPVFEDCHCRLVKL